MVNAQLIDYVKQQLAQGFSKETIEHNLIASVSGWSLADISEAFSAVEIQKSTPGQPAPATVPMAPVKYAGFWVRWVAMTVDGLILAIPILIIRCTFIFIEAKVIPPTASMAVFIVVIITNIP